MCDAILIHEELMSRKLRDAWMSGAIYARVKKWKQKQEWRVLQMMMSAMAQLMVAIFMIDTIYGWRNLYLTQLMSRASHDWFNWQTVAHWTCYWSETRVHGERGYPFSTGPNYVTLTDRQSRCKNLCSVDVLPWWATIVWFRRAIAPREN